MKSPLCLRITLHSILTFLDNIFFLAFFFFRAFIVLPFIVWRNAHCCCIVTWFSIDFFLFLSSFLFSSLHRIILWVEKHTSLTSTQVTSQSDWTCCAHTHTRSNGKPSNNNNINGNCSSKSWNVKNYKFEMRKSAQKTKSEEKTFERTVFVTIDFID